MALNTSQSERRHKARVAKRQAGRRALLLDAARRILSTEGLGALTVERVARAAELSKAAVYYYFRNKEDLVGALALQTLRAEISTVCEAAEAAPAGIDALTALVRAKVALYVGDPDGFRILYGWRQLYGVPPALAEALGRYPLAARVGEIVEPKLLQAQRAGLLRDNMTPGQMISLAALLTHGLLGQLATMGAQGAALRRVADELTEEVCQTLRGLFAVTPGRP